MLFVGHRRRAATIRATASLSLFAAGAFAVAVARSSTSRCSSGRACGFKPLQPQVVSIYDPYFWFHERHWKFCESPLQSLFKGTPFKNVISRLLGVKVGRKVFDDGCQYLEKTLIEIGDYANLNEAATLQGHSLEEGVFKSDYIKIGSGCTIGGTAFVHYGVTMGDHVVLDPDSFLMKGETVEPHATWRGNPAKAVGGRQQRSDAPAGKATQQEARRPLLSPRPPNGDPYGAARWPNAR